MSQSLRLMATVAVRAAMLLGLRTKRDTAGGQPIQWDQHTLSPAWSRSLAISTFDSDSRCRVRKKVTSEYLHPQKPVPSLLLCFCFVLFSRAPSELAFICRRTLMAATPAPSVVGPPSAYRSCTPALVGSLTPMFSHSRLQPFVLFSPLAPVRLASWSLVSVPGWPRSGHRLGVFLDEAQFCSWPLGLLASGLVFDGYDIPWEERRVRAWSVVEVTSLGGAGRLVLGSMLPRLEPSHGSASPLTTLGGCGASPLLGA